jgi:hypothetical protein
VAETVSVDPRGGRVVLTDHFMRRARERVGEEFIDIPNTRIFRAAQKYPDRKCRVLLEDRYWLFFKYERRRHQVIYLTLMPRSYLLPEPSIWVLL